MRAVDLIAIFVLPREADRGRKIARLALLSGTDLWYPCRIERQWRERPLSNFLRGNPQYTMTWNYQSLREIVRGRTLPLVLVDLEQFDANLQHFSNGAHSSGKTLRIASKSLRVPALLRRAIDLGGSKVRGLMCYSALEAEYLAESGFDDLLVAYPGVQPAEIAAVGRAARNGSTVTMMIDSGEQTRALARQWRQLEIESPLRVCIEVDVSWRKLGWHIGAHRSPVRDVKAFEFLLDEVLQQKEFQLVGIMAYESQLAGVPDRNPFTPWKNVAVRGMKQFSRPDVAEKRELLHQVIRSRGVPLDFFNGGGTGSFSTTTAERCLTEVTVGSGLLQPHLFDYYSDAVCKPAICFALSVTRCPQIDRVTCHGGGFIASGAPGPDRSPVPILPPGLRPDPNEGFGEVQTPLIVPAELQGQIQIGDPIFFRPAKAGEIAERFATYYLVEFGRIVDEVPTYRGLGKCFH